MPVFTADIFPGDVARVDCRAEERLRARELIAIDSPSSLRRAAPCPIAEECGGCDWTALRLDAQLEAKKRILTESLRRIGKFDLTTLPPITLHPSPLKLPPAFPPPSHGDAVGFYATESHRVVPLAHECEVVGWRLRAPASLHNPSSALRAPSPRFAGRRPI